ncbi:hypothetical protein GM182_07280 [bacterium 3DAC]|nr:hypothetical protein GM182_07280 [bacterium 3DAC]
MSKIRRKLAVLGALLIAAGPFLPVFVVKGTGKDITGNQYWQQDGLFILIIGGVLLLVTLLMSHRIVVPTLQILGSVGVAYILQTDMQSVPKQFVTFGIGFFSISLGIVLTIIAAMLTVIFEKKPATSKTNREQEE